MPEDTLRNLITGMTSRQGWSQKEAIAGRKAQVLVKRHPNCKQIKDETNHNQNHPKTGLSHNSPHPCDDDDLSFFCWVDVLLQFLVVLALAYTVMGGMRC
jgi:hypothetical protein